MEGLTTEFSHQDSEENNILTGVEESEHSLNQEKMILLQSPKIKVVYFESSQKRIKKTYNSRSHEISAKRKAEKARAPYLKEK